jgi:hypothetical protein
MAEPVRLLICVGSDCRKATGYAKLLALAVGTRGASSVPCQGICHGPVIGIEQRGDLRWYSRVRGERRRAAATVARTGRGRKALRSAELRGRRNLIKHADRRRVLIPR